MSIQAKSVSRNNISLTFTPLERQKGTNAGEKYLGLTKDTAPYDNIIGFLGAETAHDILIRHLNQKSIGWEGAATDDDTGVVNWEQWEQMAQGMSLRSETKVELEGMLAEVQEEFNDLTTKYLDGDETVAPKIRELRDQIKELKKDIESKSRERKPKAPKAVAETAEATV